MDKEYAVAEKKNDVAAMAADLQAKGNILAEMAKYDLAAQQFDRSLKLVEEIKPVAGDQGQRQAAAPLQSGCDGDWKEGLRGGEDPRR